MLHLHPVQRSIVCTPPMRMITELKKEVKAHKVVCPTTSTTSNTLYVRNNTTKYCWTYSARDHPSKDFKKRIIGHKEDASYADKMGGFRAY